MIPHCNQMAMMTWCVKIMPMPTSTTVVYIRVTAIAGKVAVRYHCVRYPFESEVHYLKQGITG